MQRMKTTTRGRGPNGQFVSLDSSSITPAPRYTVKDIASIALAALAAVGMALLLARCHMVWVCDNVATPVTLPQDLRPSFD